MVSSFKTVMCFWYFFLNIRRLHKFTSRLRGTYTICFAVKGVKGQKFEGKKENLYWQGKTQKLVLEDTCVGGGNDVQKAPIPLIHLCLLTKQYNLKKGFSTQLWNKFCQGAINYRKVVLWQKPRLVSGNCLTPARQGSAQRAHSPPFESKIDKTLTSSSQVLQMNQRGQQAYRCHLANLAEKPLQLLTTSLLLFLIIIYEYVLFCNLGYPGR